MTKKSWQKLKYFENEKSSQGEIKSTFHDFERAFNEANKNFFWNVRLIKFKLMTHQFKIIKFSVSEKKSSNIKK